VYPFQVLLPAKKCSLARDSKAQAEQIRSVTVERIGGVVGHLPADLADQLDRAIRLHLAL
jgi:mRNA interferase MazF